MNKTQPLLAALILFVAIALFVGCDRHETKSERTEPEKNAVVETPAGEAWRNSEPYLKLGKRAETAAVSPARVHEAHEKMLRQPLPDYIESIRGIIDVTETGNRLPAYAFEVPIDRIADFDDFLVEVGVPRKYLVKEAMIHNSLMYKGPETWEEGTEVDLVFCESNVLNATGKKTLGVAVNTGDEWWGYSLVNPHWRERDFSIKFSRVTGEVLINQRSSDEDD